MPGPIRRTAVGDGGGFIDPNGSCRERRDVLVLGIEVDFLFNCRPGGNCTSADVSRELKKHYDLGVRHLHPIHVFDNGFGGAAIYNDAVNYDNRIANGAFFAPRNCSAAGYRFKTGPAGGLGGFLADVFGIGNPRATGFEGDCNPQDLTPLGRSLMNKLMSRKMIIDIDHMSELATDTALTMAEAFDYPVVAGHTGFLDTSNDQKRTEGRRAMRKSIECGRSAA